MHWSLWQLHCCKPGPALSYLSHELLPSCSSRAMKWQRTWGQAGAGPKTMLGEVEGTEKQISPTLWGLWVGKPTSRLQWQLSTWSPQKPWLRPWDTASFWGWRHFHQARCTSFCIVQFSCYLGLSSHVHDFL